MQNAVVVDFAEVGKLKRFFAQAAVCQDVVHRVAKHSFGLVALVSKVGLIEVHCACPVLFIFLDVGELEVSELEHSFQVFHCGAAAHAVVACGHAVGHVDLLAGKSLLKFLEVEVAQAA